MGLLKQIKPWLPLFLISALSLYLELAVIRWLAGEVRILAYFKNLPLLSAFLGFSIGFALVKKGPDYRVTFPYLWGMLVALTLVIGQISKTSFMAFPSSEDVALWYVAPMSYWAALLLFIGTMLVFFFAGMLMFIPLGQATGMEMQKHAPVKAYLVNIIASLAGIWLFSLLSFLETRPVTWFGVGLAGILIFYIYLKKVNWVSMVIFAITLLGIYFVEPNTIWSPYNRLDLAQIFIEDDEGALIEVGVDLTVQHAWYQSAIDLSTEFLSILRERAPEEGEALAEIAESYNLPYWLAPAGSQVVVVGSGMGNNVAAALRNGMGRIDAVEIDPAIVELGIQYHPEHPYSDQQVQVIVDDARSFFNKTSSRYDLVVFGLLDSHTLLSGFSSVRLDSYVYTLESFQQARGILKEDGYLVITFAANYWIRERLGRMIGQVFGAENVFMYDGIRDLTFVASANPVEAEGQDMLARWQPDPAYDDLPLTTDDWPYVYMRERVIPSGYWQTYLVIGLLCFGMMARTFPESLRPDWKFFLLGAAFLLIEFKSITELALLFGTTWFVNSLAISGVLVMALLANIYVLKAKQVNLRLMYGLLFASIIAGYFIPWELLIGLSPFWRGLSGALLLTIPLLFAGVIFSALLKRRGETAGPIASNFAGSALGGVLEYGSIWWGIKGLYLLAAGLYLAAAALTLRKRR